MECLNAAPRSPALCISPRPSTTARAQRIRAAAVSGCSPYAWATRAAQPLAPNSRIAVAIACWTCAALGSWDLYSVDTNSASARAVLMLR